MAKRLLSLLLAVVTVLSLCAPAFAEGTPEPAEPTASSSPVDEPPADGQTNDGAEDPQDKTDEDASDPSNSADEQDDADDADGDETDDADDADDTGDPAGDGDAEVPAPGTEGDDPADDSEDQELDPDPNEVPDGSNESEVLVQELEQDMVTGEMLDTNLLSVSAPAPEEKAAEPEEKPVGNRLVKKSGGVYCYDSSGKKLLGWQIVDEERYFFMRNDGSGRMLKSWQDVRFGDTDTTRRYYLDPKTGVMQTGWLTLNGRKYYLEEGDLTKESTGSLALGWKVIDGAKYFFMRNDGSGLMLKGWQSIRCSDGSVKRYYLDPKTGALRTGWITSGGKKYYLIEGDLSKESTGSLAQGWQVIDGEKYFFMRNDGSGKMLTGWQDVRCTDGSIKRYYLDPKTGALKTGWITSGGRKYYLLEGSLSKESTGTLAQGWQVIDGKKYFFMRNDGSGRMLKGWQSIRCSDGSVKRYYLDPKTGALKTGWVTSGGKKYYLVEGSLSKESTGTLAQGWQVIDGKKYFFMRNDGSGLMLKGWQDIRCSDGSIKRYYLDSKTGALKTGWITSGGKKYYLVEGSLSKESTGTLAQGWQVIDGGKYFFQRNDGSGRMFTGWVEIKRDDGRGNEWYYFNSSGKMLTGWQTIGGKRYYLLPGKLADNLTGRRASGWQNVKGSDGKTTYRYYFDPNSGLMKTGWVTANGQRYYLKKGSASDESTGTPLTGWQVIDGAKYFFQRNDGSGKMFTGWVDIKRDDGKGNERYYFNSSGKLLTGWQTIDGNRYYLQTGKLADNLTGKMLTGWQTIGGKTYYISASSGMATGPTYMNGKMYLFDSNGAVQKGGTVYLCGKTYDVAKDGEILNYVTAAGKKAAGILDSIGWSLWSAYEWAAGLPYSYRAYRAKNVETYANYGFDKRTGNCYVMNSCLYQMAKMMGYDVLMRSGGVANSAGGAAPHGWCEIKIDGTWYVFDSNFHNETGGNGYKISYGQAGTWRYVKYGYID